MDLEEKGEGVGEPIRYDISLPATRHGRAAVEATCGRVTVILGANGTGKSRLLKSLQIEGPFLDRSGVIVPIYGNRHWQLPNQLTSYGPTVIPSATLPVNRHTG